MLSQFAGLMMTLFDRLKKWCHGNTPELALLPSRDNVKSPFAEWQILSPSDLCDSIFRYTNLASIWAGLPISGPADQGLKVTFKFHRSI